MVQNGEVSTKIFLDLKTIDMLTHTTQDNTRKLERAHWNRGLQSWSYVESWIRFRSSSIKLISYGQGYKLKSKTDQFTTFDVLLPAVLQYKECLCNL